MTCAAVAARLCWGDVQMLKVQAPTSPYHFYHFPTSVHPTRQPTHGMTTFSSFRLLLSQWMKLVKPLALLIVSIKDQRWEHNRVDSERNLGCVKTPYACAKNAWQHMALPKFHSKVWNALQIRSAMFCCVWTFRLILDSWSMVSLQLVYSMYVIG